MRTYKRDFVRFAIDNGVLRFGEFVLKSGRKSPYFFNAGLFNTGASLGRLGRWYAQAIEDSGIDYDMLYGPAYKGIPLVAVTAAALVEAYQRDLPYCFNRKEAKDHGEGGRTVGAPLAGRVLLIDDVISAGTSVRESAEIIETAGAVLVGVAISLDRQERGTGERSAVDEVERAFGLRVISIVTLADVVACLDEDPAMREKVARLRAYQQTYGA